MSDLQDRVGALKAAAQSKAEAWRTEFPADAAWVKAWRAEFPDAVFRNWTVDGKPL